MRRMRRMATPIWTDRISRALWVLSCPHCAGLLKQEVVFFGENVPRERVDAGMQALHDADAMLVIGSSLMVYPGYRFAYVAARAGKPSPR